jgi:hypothetical protein
MIGKATSSRPLPRLPRAIDADRLDAPTMTILTNTPGLACSLHLDRAHRLLGGSQLSPLGVAAQSAMDWIPDLGDVLAAACRRQVVAGRSWFWLPPLALVGATTEEARFVSRRIARVAGVPFLVMDISRLQDDAFVRTNSCGADLILPPDPAVAIAMTGCANPLVLVLGADQASERLASGLGDLLDPQSSPRWFCAAMGGVLDLSAVIWMVATSNEHALPTSLYTRLRQIPIAIPLDSQRRMMRLVAMAFEVMEDHDLGPADVAAELENMIDDPDGAWETISRCSASALREAVTRQLLRAVYTSAG